MMVGSLRLGGGLGYWTQGKERKAVRSCEPPKKYKGGFHVTPFLMPHGTLCSIHTKKSELIQPLVYRWHKSKCCGVKWARSRGVCLARRERKCGRARMVQGAWASRCVLRVLSRPDRQAARPARRPRSKSELEVELGLIHPGGKEPSAAGRSGRASYPAASSARIRFPAGSFPFLSGAPAWAGRW